MKTVLFQRNIVWADPDENASRIGKAFEAHRGADLFVLPEMFSTGFVTDPAGVAEPFRDGSCRSLEWMKSMAAEFNAAVAGSVSLLIDGQFINRFFFVYPDGTHVDYDKHHLFTMGGEGRSYTAGSERVTLAFRGVRIRLSVCYDLRFPMWLRNTEDARYDLLLCVASWPTPRRAAWDTLLKARAIENQCYVAGVNRVGTDPACVYNGGTAMTDPYGEVIAKCEDGCETEVEVELNMEKLASFRESFPVLHDQDRISFE